MTDQVQPGASETPNKKTKSKSGKKEVVVWKKCSPNTASGLHDKGGKKPVVGGNDVTDGGDLWVIRAMYEKDMVPGKFIVNQKSALVPWNGKEHKVKAIEVCFADPVSVCWVEGRDGNVPKTAVQGGWTFHGEELYIGRAEREGFLIPGKVHPSHKSMYLGLGSKEHSHTIYEVLCTKE